MRSTELINTIIGGVAVLILAAIGRGLIGIRHDIRRFLAEHSWLLATSLWTRDKVIQIMVKLDMPLPDRPPDDLPWHDDPRKDDRK